MTTYRLMRVLLAATSFCAAGAGGALAQTTRAGDQTALSEIVVTATRQEQTLGRVPMSIAAVTQEALTQKGVLNLYDLARAVPALTFRNQTAKPSAAINGSLLAIRGIVSLAGSSTTGVYLDDIAIQRRNLGTAGSGIPFPQLFDLERIEVLRGPQGTLYGGSSQGGAIRFITPTPSLTRRSGAVRAQASVTEGGDPSAEMDGAIGGPIVQDRLGFRLSGIVSKVGGYIDHIDPSNGRQILNNSNWGKSYAIRGALLWRPTERLKVEPTVYYTNDNRNDNDSYWSNVPAYTLPSATFGATGAAATGAAVRFTRPALNYPALNFYGPGRTGELATAPRKSAMVVYALNLDYDFGWFTAKSITGYEHDTVVASTFQNANLLTLHAPLWGGYDQLNPTYLATSNARNRRDSASQEIRLSSRQDQRFTWVAGAYYNHSAITSRLDAPENELSAAALALRGVSATTFYNVDFEAAGHITAASRQDWNDTTLAGFADGTFALTDKLKVEAGVRASKETFRFNSCTYGIARGVLACTLANANFLNASTSSSPVSPKVGVTYQVDSRNMVYATASKGFRTGGINTPVPNQPTCAAALALIGRTPTTFDPDYVTSYEAGAKLRLLGGRAQVNSSVYRIDWTDIQLAVALPGCPFTYTANAGRARSQGFDIQSNIKLLEGLTADLSVAYTDARYVQTTSNRDPTGAVISVVAFKGDQLPTAPWTLDLGLNYDFKIMGDRPAYARVDYQYSSRYHRTTGPGSLSYAADTYNATATQIVNARVGAIIKGADVALFAKNLFNSQDIIDSFGGRVCGKLTDPTCAAPASTSFQYYNATFRPRELGVTVTYKY